MKPALHLAIAAGVLGALPLAIAVNQPSGMLLLLLAPLPLFAAGLAQGLIGGLVAGGTMLVAAALLAGLLAAVGALIFIVGPSLILVRQALLNRPAASAGGGGPAGPGDLEWYPSGLLLTWLLWIGVAWLTVSMLMLASEGVGLQTAVQTGLEQTLQASLPQFDPAQTAEVAQRMSAIALGFGVVSWLLFLALNGTLAQNLLVRFGRNLRPSPDLVSLSLPNWIAPVLAVVLAVAFLVSGDIGFVAKNLAPVLLLPFFFVGLAVTHAYARQSRFGGPLLAFFYLLLVLFTWPAVVVVILGLLDQWANLRQRIAAGASGQEEE